VKVVYDESSMLLNIIDSGKGIKNPKRIFERFYKEQDRGIGIGLHIVKKLCDELGIKIGVQSILESGTTFSLDLSKLTLR
jgi:two-component system, OmpR family, sensor kinase